LWLGFDRPACTDAPSYQAYSFLDRGSDERQYCSPGIDLPVCSVIRSKYGVYPEYHTSFDNLSLISPQGLQGGFDVVRQCIELLEGDLGQEPISRRPDQSRRPVGAKSEASIVYRATVPCEPQLGKRGLYPTLSTRESHAQMRNMMNLLAYADGAHDLSNIAETIGVPAGELMAVAEALQANNLLEIVRD
jgi:aminopeptidase-like protein